MHEDVRKKLTEVAKRRDTITYGELMREFHISRRVIGDVVGEVSEYEYKKGRPFISAIVVQTNSATRIYPKGMPGGGFLGISDLPSYIRRLDKSKYGDPLNSKEQEFISKEQSKVWNYWEILEDLDEK